MPTRSAEVSAPMVTAVRPLEAWLLVVPSACTKSSALKKG